MILAANEKCPVALDPVSTFIGPLRIYLLGEGQPSFILFK